MKFIQSLPYSTIKKKTQPKHHLLIHLGLETIKPGAFRSEKTKVCINLLYYICVARK